MGWVVCSDAVVESCDAVLIFVVTASRYICDAVSSHYREILNQCWCSDEDEEDEVHTTTNAETEDISLSKSSSPRSSQIQELTNQVLILQAQKHKLELEKNKAKAEAEVALLKAQPPFPNVGQLNELLVSSVQAKLKTLDALPGLLLNVTKAVNKFAQVFNSASSKAGDQSVPLAGQPDAMPAVGEKNTNQATISQLF
ncbi:hypothetical protein Tco_0001496 [Tanacetum coccineum]